MANQIQMNSIGVSHINKTGFTKLGIRFDMDRKDTPVPEDYNVFSINLKNS